MENVEKFIDSNGMIEYLLLEELGHGSYGRVFKIEKRTLQSESQDLRSRSEIEGNNDIVNNKRKFLTLKRFFFDKYRSSKSLVENQLNIITKLKLIDKECYFTPVVYDYIKSDENDAIISDFYEYNLSDIIQKVEFNETNSEFYKSLIFYLLSSLDFLHSNHIMHRDLKPDNIMINSNGEIKFIDFDLLKNIENQKDPNTKGVYTIYYRPAEILFGDTNYDYKADIWAIGCVLAEIFLKTPIFKSENEFYLLDSITNIIGLINESSFPGVSKLSNYFELDEPETVHFDKLMNGCEENLKNLISLCLNLNPLKRPFCKDLLKNKYFDALFEKQKEENDESVKIQLVLKYCKGIIKNKLFV